ncbi:MAG: D-alanyl-D-alanine carboxypeptidase [Peptostreptococcaceae bacterium]|nr:D-alanyl-D-alanine carboxypeptidase [Peptostreptococcaceae bacterium]
MKTKKIINMVILLTILSFNIVFAQDNLQIEATNAIAIDYDTNEIIYAKDIDTRVYPASITKLLTALLLSEKIDENSLLTFTKTASEQPSYSYSKNVHPVKIGDQMTLKNTLDALLLYSANDIAYMVADNVSGNSKNFEILMNKRLKELNMLNSNFITPNGLDSNTNNHYTTTYDLTKLMKASYDSELIRNSISKTNADVRFLDGPVAHFENRNKLTGNNGCIGGKTGYTKKAGRCLLSIYERDNKKIIMAVMNSKYNLPEDSIVFEDMSKLADFAYNKKQSILYKKGEILKTIKKEYNIIPFIGPTVSIDIPIFTKENILYYDSNLDVNKKIILKDFNPWDLDDKFSLANLNIQIRDYNKSYDLYTSVTKKDLFFKNLYIYIIALVLILALIVFIIKFFTRNKRRNIYSNRRYY